MSEPATTVADQDTVEVEHMDVACDGGTPALGHPKVYLHVDPESRDVVCPYCSRRFVLKDGIDPHAAGH